MSNTEWLTREQAAEWLSCGTRTITTIIKEMESKGIPGIYRAGRFVRINKEEMSNYMKERRFT